MCIQRASCRTDIQHILILSGLKTNRHSPGLKLQDNLFIKLTLFFVTASTFLVPAMLSVKRQVADPTLGVGDMMKVLRAELASKQSWDLWKYLQHPKGNVKFDRKTAPHPGFMAQTADLMYRFCSIAPNGILQGSKLRQAILKLGHERKINWSRYNEDEFCDQCDSRIRVLLSQFRLVKQKAEEYSRCMRKASEAEQAAIDKVLSVMCLEQDAEEEAMLKKQKTEGEEGLEKASCAVAAASTAASSSSSTSRRDGSAAKGIFQKILQKQDSNTSQEAVDSSLALVPVVPAQPEASKAPSAQGSFRKGQHRPPGFGVLPEEDLLLPASPVVVKKKAGAFCSNCCSQKCET